MYKNALIKNKMAISSVITDYTFDMHTLLHFSFQQ